MPETTRIQIVGWLHVVVIVTIILLGFLFERAEILRAYHEADSDRRVMREQIDSLQATVSSLQGTQKKFCYQYMADMDHYFRDHPETKRIPWICE
jgi:hypothetical protein